MKKILIALCALCVLSALASCGSSVQPAGTAKETETAVKPTEILTAETEEETETQPAVELGERYAYHAVTLNLPAGFTVQEADDTVLAVPSDYPAHTDNIALTFTKNYGNPDSIPDEQLKSEYESAVGALKSFSVERVSMLAHDCMIIDAEFEMNGAVVFQKQYVVFVGGNATHVTFTLAENSEYAEIFRAVVASFSIED